jgi:hypothetical protein
MPVDPTKTHLLNEGRVVGSNICNYGGFPRILKETHQDPKAATLRFNDANDISPSDEKIATRPDEEKPWTDKSLIHRGYRYPSKALMALAQAADKGDHAARLALYSHPHYEEFKKGSPEFRNRPTKSDFGTYTANTRIDSSREGT